MPSVFFVRCRPQGADIIDLVRECRRVFIGYPAWRARARFDRHNLNASLVSPALPDEDWYRQHHSREENANHTLVQEVDREPGSIVLIPRPDRGLIYVGKVGRFEIVNDPPWVEKYIQMRHHQGCDEGAGFESHVGDVCQGWPVKRFVPLPYSAVPSWIRKSFMGRRQHGRILGVPKLGLDPYLRIRAILDSAGQAQSPDWTNELAVAEQRLVDFVGPQSFEHLCVNLLQLMHPDQAWFHVGGSGDGGVDGLGYAEDGAIRGILQCKWEYWGGDLPFLRAVEMGANRYIAALVHPDEGQLDIPAGATFISRRQIAKFVVQNAGSLPQAISLRIGRPRLKRKGL